MNLTVKERANMIRGKENSKEEKGKTTPLKTGPSLSPIRPELKTSFAFVSIPPNVHSKTASLPSSLPSHE